MNVNTYFTMLLFFVCCFSACRQSPENLLILKGRSRVNGSGDTWEIVEQEHVWKTEETAIIICDMWDKHWCKKAARRVENMAPVMNEVIKAARKNGVSIIHAPSETMDFYQSWPQRARMTETPWVEPPAPITYWYHFNPVKEAPLPVDISDGGCDDAGLTQDGTPWTRQIPAIDIAAQDGISDNGQEIYNYFAGKGIKNVILMGVHLNICVIGRSFGIRAQLEQGKNVVFVRDLTDVMYNPAMPPYVSHQKGLELVIQQVEKYLCPSIPSGNLTRVYNTLQPTSYVEKPVITPAGDIHFEDQMRVTIRTGTYNAEIRYRTDGKEPDSLSELYKGPFNLTESSIVTAKAFKKGSIASPTRYKAYTFVDTMKNGLHYEYYEGTWSTLPDFKKIQPVKSDLAITLDPSLLKLREDHFGIVYKAFIHMEDNGLYTFFLTSDDGSKLFIDQKLVVDNDGSHGSVTKNETVELFKGIHFIEIHYFDDYESEALHVFYKNPGGEKIHLNAGNMYPKKNVF